MDVGIQWRLCVKYVHQVTAYKPEQLLSATQGKRIHPLTHKLQCPLIDAHLQLLDMQQAVAAAHLLLLPAALA